MDTISLLIQLFYQLTMLNWTLRGEGPNRLIFASDVIIMLKRIRI